VVGVIIGGAWSGSATTHFSAVIQRSSHFVCCFALSLTTLKWNRYLYTTSSLCTHFYLSLVLSSTQWHYSGQACLDVGHMSVLDTDPTLTFIITLNCIIFLNYYWCRCVGVRVVSVFVLDS
jgi:hypothetical protein